MPRQRANRGVPSDATHVPRCSTRLQAEKDSMSKHVTALRPRDSSLASFGMTSHGDPSRMVQREAKRWADRTEADHTEDHSGTGVQAVARAIRLLAAMASTENGATLTELSRATGLPKSTARRLLITLGDDFLVRQASPSGPFTLGPELLLWADQARNQLLRNIAAHSALRWLRDVTNETVHLAIPDGHHMVYIDKVESKQTLQIASRIGSRLDLYSTSLGKAYLAYCPPAFVDEYLESGPFPPKTAKTMTDLGALIDELCEIRERGYAIDYEENELGIGCISAPIHNRLGKSVAAVSLTAPIGRLTDENIASWSKALLEAAGRMGDSRIVTPVTQDNRDDSDAPRAFRQADSNSQGSNGRQVGSNRNATNRGRRGSG